MSVIVGKDIVNAIVAKLPPDKAAAYVAGLSANGVETAETWEFEDNEAWLRCNDLFYPNGRPPGPRLPPRPMRQLTGAEMEAQWEAQGLTLEQAKRNASRRSCCDPPPIKESSQT